jgi:hypothetical protein
VFAPPDNNQTGDAALGLSLVGHNIKRLRMTPGHSLGRLRNLIAPGDLGGLGNLGCLRGLGNLVRLGGLESALALRSRRSLFHMWLVHRRRGSHDRAACCGYYVLVGLKTPKHPFAVGDGILAKLKCVIHARLPPFLSLCRYARRQAQSEKNDKHNSLLHRGSSFPTITPVSH